MKLEGEKIYLKPFTKKYAADWVRWTQDEEVTRYSVMRSYTLEEELKFIEEREKNPDPDLILGIFLKENDKIIGNCGTHKPDNKKYAGKTFVGIIIGEKNEWGKGYGTDAMKTLLKYAKEKLGLKEVYLNVDIPNIPAQKCYKKCGFKIFAKEKAPERKNSGGEHYVMRVDLSTR
jgi:RimJ/RimL family protein N-acetyltransferase